MVPIKKAPAMELNGKYVTWKGHIGTCMIGLTFAGGLAAWAWGVHIESGHNGTATSGQLQLLEKRMVKDTTRLEVRQIRIEDKIDQIRDALP